MPIGPCSVADFVMPRFPGPPSSQEYSRHFPYRIEGKHQPKRDTSSAITPSLMLMLQPYSIKGCAASVGDACCKQTCCMLDTVALVALGVRPKVAIALRRDSLPHPSDSICDQKRALVACDLCFFIASHPNPACPKKDHERAFQV